MVEEKLIIQQRERLLTESVQSLRESLWSVIEEQPFGVVEYFRYAVEADASAAEALAPWLSALTMPTV